MSIRLLICDDHLAIQLGVEALLRGSEIEIVGHALSGREAVRLATSTAPNVVLLDIRVGSEDGLDALLEIKRAQPALPVLIFSVGDELNDMARAHRLGANGYLLKTLSREELLRAIHRAVSGRKVWSTTQIRRVKSRGGTAAGNQRKQFPLSDREKQVLEKIVQGTSSNEAIAEDLQIDIETVKQYVRSILKKLHVADRTQAALWAMRNRLGEGSRI